MNAPERTSGDAQQMSRVGHVGTLLGRLFNDKPGELARILGKNQVYKGVTLKVIDPTSAPDAYYHDVASCLERDGLVDENLFAVLLREKPRWEREIDDTCLACLGRRLSPRLDEPGPSVAQAPWRASIAVGLAVLLALAVLTFWWYRGANGEVEDLGQRTEDSLQRADPENKTPSNASAAGADLEKTAKTTPVDSGGADTGASKTAASEGPKGSRRRPVGGKKSDFDEPPEIVTGEGNP